MKVYKWPPVGTVGREWTVEDLVGESRSLFTGATWLSAAQRRRRLAGLSVSARSNRGQGAGYMEALKRLLRGGLHAVRLQSQPINHGRGEVPDSVRQAWPLAWRSGPNPLAWRTGSAQKLVFYSGGNGDVIAKAEFIDTGVSGLGRMRVTGLPRSARVARVGEFVTIYGQVNETRMLVRPVDTDPDGATTIWVDEPFSGGGRINFGTSETGVFRAVEIPRAPRPRFGDWYYDWEFREVFEDEYSDGFTEINPWG